VGAVTTRADPVALHRLPMVDFLRDYYAPDLGQHVALVGPNGCGKTTIGMQLLAATTAQHAKLRGVALVMKPHKGPKSEGRRATGDKTVANLTRTLGGKITRDWPPPPIPWRQEPPFWALWPPHTGEPDADDDKHYAIFRRCIIDLYKKGDSVLFCDEAAGLSADLDLKTEMRQTLQRGRSLNASAILATQRPVDVPRSMFTEAKHFFLWRMNDAREYEVISLIGGGRLTKQDVTYHLTRLGKHECLYLYPDKNVAVILV
jgi:hypothetical protein